MTKTKPQFIVAAAILQLIEERQKKILLQDLTKMTKLNYATVRCIITRWGKDGFLDVTRYEYRSCADGRKGLQVMISLRAIRGIFLILYDILKEEKWEEDYVEKIGMPRCEDSVLLKLVV